MSDFNLEWLHENFADQPITLFNIGCADITHDTWRFTLALPAAIVWSFECADHWKLSNIEKAKLFGFNYQHQAVSYYDGQAIFADGLPHRSNDGWEYRGHVIAKSTEKNIPRSNHTYTVAVTSLNTFCRDYKIKPDILHIDTEGEEYNILKNLEKDLFPMVIWLEYSSVYRNGENQIVKFDQLDDFVVSKGYRKKFQQADVLYVKQDLVLTEYKPFYQLKDNQSAFEKSIQQRIWLTRYHHIKDESWPCLTHPSQFFDLPYNIQEECSRVFNLTPLPGLVD